MTKSILSFTDEDVPQIASTAGDDGLFDALIQQESGGKQFDKSGKPLTSKAGAIGIAQVMPGTAPEAAQLAGVEYDEMRYRTDAEYNKTLGRAYLRKQMEDFGGDRSKALAAYNAGPGALRRALQIAETKGHPDAWLQYMPAETQAYVPSIMRRGGAQAAKPGAAPAAPADPQKTYYERDETPYVVDTPIPTRSTFEAIADSALGFASGAASAAGSIAAVAGADNAVARGLTEAARGMEASQSPQRQAQRARRAMAIQEAERSGDTLAEIGAYLGTLADAPVETVLNAVGSTAPTLLVAMIPGLNKAAAARFIATGAVGAAQGAGAVKTQIYESVYQQLKAAGVSEAEAQKAAIGAQEYAGANADQILIGAGLGAVAGTTGAEVALAKIIGHQVAEAGAKGLLRTAARGAAFEALPEAIQGGQERMASNIALQREGFDVPTMEGVLGQGALEGAAAAPLGAGSAAAARRVPVPAGLEKVAEKAAEPDSPLSKAALAGNTGPLADAARAAQENATKIELSAQNDQFNDHQAAQAAQDAQQAQLTEEIAQISDKLRARGALEPFRAPDAPINAKKVVDDMAIIQSPSTRPAQREQALARLRYAMEWADVQTGAEPRGTTLDNTEEVQSNTEVAFARDQENKKFAQQQPAAPETDQVVEALRVEPALRTAEQTQRVIQAKNRLSPADFAILEKAAVYQAGMSATDKLRLQQLRGVADPAKAAGADAAITVAQESGDQVQSANAPEILEVGTTVPKAGTPAGAGPAVFRRRRAQLRQVIDMGLNRVERQDDGSFVLTDGRRSLALDSAADAQLARAELQRKIREGAEQANTNPTEGQKQAGNYKKGRVEFDGLKLGIENPIGSTRSGKAPDGTEWSVTMTADYGDLTSTTGADGDGVDVYLAPNPRPGSAVFVFDQYGDDGKFDEHKAVLGAASEAAATQIYDAHFSDGSGPRRRRAVTQMSVEEFKSWANSPAAKQPSEGAGVGQSRSFAVAVPSARPAAEPADAGAGVADRGAGAPRADAGAQRRSGAAEPGAGDGRADAAERRGARSNVIVLPVAGKRKEIQLVDLPDAGRSEARGDERRAVGATTIDVLRAVAELFGKKVAVFKYDAEVGDGFVHPSYADTIFVSERTSINPMAVLGHEAFHKLRAEQPELYASVEKVLRARIKDGGNALFRADYDKDKSGNDAELNDAEMEEFASDVAGNLMLDPTFWREVMDQVQKDQPEKAKSLIAKLTDFVTRLLDRALSAIQGKPFATTQLVNDLEAVRAAYKDALAQYIQANGIRQQAMQAETLRAKQKANVQQSKPRDITETPQFKKWFGDSKVVDAEGKPLVMYHGTAHDFSTQKGRLWTTARPDHASLYAESRARHPVAGQDAAPVVMPVYVSLRNPLLVDGNGEPYWSIPWDNEDGYSNTEEIASYAEDEGFDGVIFTNVSDRPDEGGEEEDPTTVVVAFRPEQIKSAIGNNGDFDAASSDITRSSSRDNAEREQRPGAEPATSRSGNDTPSYGTAQPGSVSAVGVHFSQQPRTRLDAAHYGTGAKGLERERLSDAADIRPRVFFYVDKGNGVRPEAGVGGVAHRVELNNLYDVWADPLQIVENNPGPNNWERAIMRAGFDGYLSLDPKMPQGFAVLVGKKHTNVPVQQFTPPGFSEPVQQPAETRKALTSGEIGAVNVEAIPGAKLRSGTLIVPAESRDQANAEMERIGSEIRFSAQRDMFDGDFAKLTDEVDTERVVSSAGDTERGVNVNSEGKKIALTKQALESFWRWFGNSEAVDKTGRPQVFFHTTRNGGFDEFEVGRMTKRGTTFGDYDVSTHAIFFTDDVRASEEYGKKAEKFVQGAAVMPVYLKTENILDMTGGYLSNDVARQFDAIGFNSRFLHQFDWSKFDDEEGRDFVAAAKRIGYDAVKFWDEIPGDGEVMISFQAIAVFEPSQIKSSIGNIGSFDSTANVTRSAARSEAFDAWFSDSKAVDADGNPLTLYHGTQSNFKEFDPQRLGQATNHATAGLGFYFSTDPRVARIFGRDPRLLTERNDDTDLKEPRAISKDQVIMPVFLAVKNPYRMELGRFSDIVFNATPANVRAMRAELERRGHDGILIPKPEKFFNPETAGDTWIAFEPEQIKSAIGNDGNYRIDVADITRSTARGRRDGLRSEVVEAAGAAMRYLTPTERAKLRVDTATKLYDLFSQMPSANEMAAVAHAGKAKRGWYHNSAQALMHVFGPDAPRFAALLAAMSPQTSVEVNLRNALSTWKNWTRAGRPIEKAAIFEIMGRSVEGNKLTDSVLPAWVNNSVRALSAEDPETVVLSGPKVNSFMLNLRGVTHEVTNDAWMANYAAVDQRIFAGSLTAGGDDPGKGPGYLAMSARVRQAAMRLTDLTGEDWTPAEVQETVWSWAKTLYELQSKDLGARELLENEAVTDELIASTPDFRTQLHEERNEETLRQAGYGEELDSLRERGSDARPGDEGSEARGQAAPFDRDAQGRLLRKAASRLEQLRDNRAAAEAVTRAGKENDEQESIQRSTERDGGGQRRSAQEPLPGAPRVEGATGPDARLVAVAEAYARANGIDLRRQGEYAQVDEDRARRIAAAYEAMPHAPQDPKVRAAYEDLIRQTRAQYDALVDAGYRFYFADQENDPYAGNPWNAMRDLRANRTMAVFPTAAGFGSDDAFDPAQNPLLADTGLVWGYGSEDGPGMRVLANDLFRAVHDAFGHGLEGAGFRAQGEENAWQAHVRLFTGPAVGAITSETRGQNSWLNYGPAGEKNRTAKVEDTVFADQKTGLMPEWTWTEGRVGDDIQRSAPRTPTSDDEVFRLTHDLEKRYGLDRVDAHMDGGDLVFDVMIVPRRLRNQGVGSKVVREMADFADERGLRIWAQPAERGDLEGEGTTSKARLIKYYKRFGFEMSGNRTAPSGIEYEMLREPQDIQRSAPRDGFDAVQHAERNLAAEKALAASGLDIVENTMPWIHDGEILNKEFTIRDVDGEQRLRAWFSQIPDTQGKYVLQIEDESGEDIDEIVRSPQRDVTQTAQFKAWFGDSKVVDADGKPLVVYHGSAHPSWSDGRSEFGRTNGMGEGAYFTPNPEVAAEYADMDSEVEGDPPFLLPVYLSIQNPKIIRDSIDMQSISPEQRGEWEAQGYDGMMGYYGEKLSEIAVWNPEQIKSAIGNDGSFDPNSADITRSPSRTVQVDGDRLPIHNSKGQVIHPDFKGQVNFWRWFGDSKVVDERGRPMQVYHGTNQDVSAFDRLWTVKELGRRVGPDSIGSWFSTNPSEDGGAGMYGSTIMPAYLSIKKPIEWTYAELMEALDDKLPKGAKRKAGPEEVEALREELAFYGYDGIKIVHDPKADNGSKEFEKQDAWIALNPEQIKSATGNDGSFDAKDADITRSTQRAPTWYSQLEIAIASVPERLATMSAPQWKLWLDANAQKYGVKKEEIEWSGIKDYLSLRGKEKISADDLADYVRQHGVQLGEVVLGGMAPGYRLTLPGGETMSYDAHNVDELERDHAEFGGEISEIAFPKTGDTKYQQYTIPGGTNYREVLITLPDAAARTNASRPNPEALRRNRDNLAKMAGVAPEIVDDYIGYVEQHKTLQAISDAAHKDGRDGMHQLSLFIGSKRIGDEVKKQPDYKSSHWDAPNVLAHIRVDDRTDAEGKKVLFVNEIQSDWGAEGRKKRNEKIKQLAQERGLTEEDAAKFVPVDAGFAGKPMPAEEMAALEARLQELKARRRQMVAADRAAGRDQISSETDAVLNEEAELQARINVAKRAAESGVPLAPYVTDTKSWVALAIKRAIKMAVDGGYDKVAFVTGEQAADFFDLSKQVRHIGWDPQLIDGQTQKRVRIRMATEADMEFYVNDKGVIDYVTSSEDHEHLSDKPLEDVVGKEIATKIMETKQGLLERDGLKIGGEGMRGFYDKIVPQVANDVLKKIGGGKVGEVRLQAGERPQGDLESADMDAVRDYHDISMRMWNSLGRQQQNELVREYLSGGEVNVEERAQPGFDITPKMREALEGGAPLFSTARGEIDKQRTMLDRMRPTGADPIASSQQVMEEKFHGMTREEVNDGCCDEYAAALLLKVGGEHWGTTIYSDLPVHEWVEVNGKAYDSESPEGVDRWLDLPYFKRNWREPEGVYRSTLRDTNVGFGYKVADFLDSSKKVTWWDKSVGTPYHLAQKHPTFKRVYNAVQFFISDTSKYATRAADLAPNFLPKLEHLKDVFKSPLSAEDVKALQDPIFQGTLGWTRDAEGNPVETEDVGAAGIVWTDTELRTMWRLDDRQIALYREFRKSVNKSIADLAITGMVRYAGDDAEGVRGRVLAANNVQAAADILADHLAWLAANDSKRANTLQNAARVVGEMADQARGLMARGYAPLSRFGQYTVYAPEIGDTGFFELFETEADANKRARQLRAEHRGAKVEVGTMSQESWKLFKGVTPETLELFGEALGLEESASERESQVFQEYLRLARSTRSAMKRLIQRKGVDGYSQDAARVLAAFVYSNARQAAQNLNSREMLKAAADVPDGDLKDHAIRLVEYAQNPQEEAQAIRGMLFAQYIGGSIASAMVNLTQTATTTWPVLSQHFGIGRAGKALGAAVEAVRTGAAGDADLAKAMKRAEEEGITAPQETHQLMAIAAGKAALATSDGTKVGSTLTRLGNGLGKVRFVWGKMFSWAEMKNREIAFAAAYKLAREAGERDPYAFAKDVVAKTQFVLNKGNNAQWARGPVGATLFTFRKFMVMYLEGLARMWGAGPEGKKAFALSLAVLFMLAGTGGFPFAEDLDDLIDAFAQRVLNKSFSSKAVKKEFFAKILGDAGAQFVEGGLSSLPGFPIDVSGRLGMGNIIPGTGLLPKKQNYGRDTAEIAGAAGDMAKRMLTAAGQASQGELTAAASTVMPVAIGNALKAAEMWNTGVYKDQKGRKVIDVDGTEAIFKAIGFQPKGVQRIQEAAGIEQSLIAQNKIRETEIADLWARGRIEKKPELVEDAKRQLREWNAANPSSPISIEASQIAKRVKQANMTKAKRLELTAPREIRKSVGEALQAR